MYVCTHQSRSFFPVESGFLHSNFDVQVLFLLELTLGRSDVMQHKSMLPALPSTAHLPCLGRIGRIWWQCQNIFVITDQENARLWDYGEEFHFMYGFLFTDGYSIDWRFLTYQEKRKIFRMRKIIWLGRVGNKTLFSPTSWGTYRSSKHCFITKYRRHKTSEYTKQCTGGWTKLWKQAHQQLDSKLHLKWTYDGMKLLFTKRIWH